jgi:hypothetical protein
MAPLASTCLNGETVRSSVLITPFPRIRFPMKRPQETRPTISADRRSIFFIGCLLDMQKLGFYSDFKKSIGAWTPVL